MALSFRIVNLEFHLKGTVTGWGATMENGDISVNLQEVNVPIISNIDCRMTGYGATRITDNMLCAGYPDGKKDSCQVRASRNSPPSSNSNPKFSQYTGR